MVKLIADPEAAIAEFNLGVTPEPSVTEAHVAEINDALEKGQEIEELTEEEQASLYEEVAKIDAAIETLTARREQIKVAFRRLDYGTSTVHPESKGAVTIGHNPIFSELRFITAHPYDEPKVEKVVVKGRRGKDEIVEQITYPNRELYKITPDRPAMKRILDEDEYKSFFDEGEKKVTIR